MTESQLQTIERELGVRLPEDYRETSLDFPFQPRGNDWVYWMYDEPDRIIGETLAPLADGEYDQTNWKPSYLVIGQSAAGDLYLLDTAQGDDSPVYCLSHEDHSIEEEWAHFLEFVGSWLINDELQGRDLESKARSKNRRVFLFTFFAGIFLLALTPMLLYALIRSGIPAWLILLPLLLLFTLLIQAMVKAIRGGIYY